MGQDPSGQFQQQTAIRAIGIVLESIADIIPNTLQAQMAVKYIIEITGKCQDDAN